MECRFLQTCLLLAVIAICGSYAYSYGRRGHGYGYYHGEPHQNFYASVHHPGGYHGPPREAHIRGAIFKHDDDDHGDRRRQHRHREESEESHDDDHHDDDHHEEEHRIYRFQVSDDFDANAYTDSHGRVHGFLMDLMREVCQHAHKECFFMVDTSAHCWDTSHERERPGVGLLDHYYDGCMGYWQSATRKNSFNFTVPFTPDVTASLHYKAGETHENPTTVTGAKIGFVSGWPISHGCFERQKGFVGNSPGKYTPVMFDTHRHMIDALTKGEINGVVTIDSYDDSKLGIAHVDPSFKCTENGASVMTLYGSDVLAWWNSAFEDMQTDGSFDRLCAEARRDHGSHGTVNCIRRD